MPLCPLDGHCAYNNRNVCGVDYCLFPIGGCPHDLLRDPPDDPVLYRRALGGTIAVLVEMGAAGGRCNTEEVEGAIPYKFGKAPG